MYVKNVIKHKRKESMPLTAEQKAARTTDVCTGCEASIPKVKDMTNGEIVVCPDCGANLEIMEIVKTVAEGNPELAFQMILAFAPEEREDFGE